MDIDIDIAISFVKRIFPDNTSVVKIGKAGQKLVLKVSFSSQPELVFKMILVGEKDDVSEYLVKRAERELQILKGIRYSGIVSLDDRYQPQRICLGNYTFIAYAEEPLTNIVNTEYVGNEALCLKFLFEVLSTLKYLYEENNIIHRDIKPLNILKRASDSRHVIIDFGLAGIKDLSTITNGGSIGTLRYMSPEQIKDTHSVDLRTDMFSVGLTVYELYTGHYPFKCEDLKKSILFQEVEFGEQFEEASPSFKAILTRLLKKSPHQRYKSYDEPIEILNNLLK